jgi:pilus assembly protein CpaC
VRSKAGICALCFFAWCFTFFVEPTLQAETPRPVSQPVQTSGHDSANDLSVTVGKSVLVDSARPIARISVGLGEVAEATATSPTEVLVNGKAPGETSLIVWEVGGGRQFYNVTVRPSTYAANEHLEAVRRELRAELAGQAVRVSSENGLIFLRGTVKDLTSSDRALQIASTEGKVVNLLYVDLPPAEPQILLKVRFASIDRNLSKQLGINLFTTGLGNTVGGITTGQFSPPFISSTPASVTATAGGIIATPATTTATFSNEGNFLAIFPGLQAGADITALESKGLVQILAEPNMIAQNGKQATFLAGGEYPFPVVQGGGAGTPATVTIQFKEYGIRLNFIPTITPRGTIHLQVAPEVSALDFSNAIQISGFNVPAIDTRKVKTEVELSENQSFVIGGLLDNRETQTFEKIPFLGDIPILGKFFQSMTKNRTNTELIVIVTPEIVAPIPAGAPLPELKYPEKFLPPNSKIPMSNPDAKVTGASPLPPPPATVPVEQLIQSMQPEKPLSDNGYGSNGAYGSSQSGMSTSSAPPAPQ